MPGNGAMRDSSLMPHAVRARAEPQVAVGWADGLQIIRPDEGEFHVAV